MSRHSYLCTHALSLILSLLLSSLTLQSQITMGNMEIPISGALLQLKNIEGITDSSPNSSKGLSLPRIVLETLTPNSGKLAESIGGDSQLDDEWDEDKHIALLVYDANEDVCAPPNGLYVWDGIEWQGMGLKKELSDDVYEVTDPRDGEVYLARNFGAVAGDWMLLLLF